MNRNLFKNIKVNVPDKIIDTSGYTIMADIKTHMPSDGGYHMFLLVINITSRQLDIMPLRNKTAEETKEAFNVIWRRRNIRNIRSTKFCVVDGGSEFKGNFKKYMDAHAVRIIESNTYHINSTGIVERAIGTVTKVILEYLNNKALETRRRENKWVHLLPEIIYKINLKATPKYQLKDIVVNPPVIPKNVLPIGTLVHKRLPYPVHLLNGVKKYKFRNGDRRFATTTSKVTDYRIRNNRPLSYILDDDYRIGYQQHEVLMALNQ